MKKSFLFITIFILVAGCKTYEKEKTKQPLQYITILGIAQDGGFPHIGCQKECCDLYYKGELPKQKVVSLGLIDKESNQKFLFEATPDISTQLADLEKNHLKTNTIIDGVFITHAHIGHYAGLLYFGREALGKKDIPVHVMPKMKNFLQKNGPWSQLIDLQNIACSDLQKDSTITVSSSLKSYSFPCSTSR